MKRVIKTTLAAVASLVALVSLSSCSAGPSANTNGPTISIGIKFDQPGLGYKQGNNYSGFDIDVARYVANYLGYSSGQIVWKSAPSSERESMLEDGEVDMVVASYSITDARKKVVDFSNPYLFVGQDLLVDASNTSITGPDSLVGKNVCSVTGSTSAEYIKEKYGNKVHLTLQSGYEQCVTALLVGSVDAATTDDAILAGLSKVRGDNQLKLVGQPFTKESYGIGVRKGDVELTKDINAALKEYVSSGRWEKDIASAMKGTGWEPDPQWNPPAESSN
jgi:glutamate transport system substrate-binding protein